MENKKQQKGSSSSLTSQLFGPQESSSSNDVLASIFPPHKGVGPNSGCSEVRGSWQKEPCEPGNQPWSAKQDNMHKHGEASYGYESSSANRNSSSSYQQEGENQPCHLSSSLYYGGREMYCNSPTNQTSTSSYPIFKKDGGDDDPSGASRGNWWQGSLYY